MDAIAQISKYQFKTPIIRGFGYAIWLVFGLLSVIYFKERVAFMDGAFQLVNLINTEEFSIHHNRLTNPLTQIFAYIGIKLRFPLKYVMIGYSINFIVFHLIIYHIIIKWCKNDFLGLVQIGFFTLFVTQSFYFLPPEFYQGMSILLLWTAILLQPSFQNKKWRFSLLCLLLIPIIFDHALLSAFTLFIWIFLWIHDYRLIGYHFFGLLAFIIFVYIIHDIYFTGWYDEARKGYFWRHWNQYYPHFERIPGNKIFLQRCWNTYYFFPLFLLGIIVGYLKSYFSKNTLIKHPLLKLILVLGFCFFYILINHINDPKTPYLFYSQVNYIGLAIPIMIPICFDFLPSIVHKKYTIYIIGIILLIRIITIIETSNTLKVRHAWMLDKIENNENNKIYMNRNEAPKEMLIQVWSVPEETLLLSSLKNPKSSASLLIKRSDYKYISALDSTNIFLRTHSAQPLDQLNPRYFNLGEDVYLMVKDLNSD